MTTTVSRLDRINDFLGPARLAWFGTRGLDALPLCHLRPLSVIYSQIAPTPPGQSELLQDCLETRTSRRRDLDNYNIDLDQRAEARGLRNAVLENVGGPVVIIAYRPAELLAKLSFCRSDIRVATNFHLMQRMFEHKPWVESQMEQNIPGVRVIPWTHVRDNDLESIAAYLAGGPAVGRTSTGAGGAGVFRFSSVQEYVDHMPAHTDGFVSLSRFVRDAAPLNVNACVYAGGEVTVFAVSYQLIGVDGLTHRPFGFCGNDFLAARALPRGVLEDVERQTRAVGAWLASSGYRGNFGLDLLAADGEVLITELNPRFQFSTPLCARICQEVGGFDPMVEHLAAFLGLPPPPMPSCAEQVEAAADASATIPTAQVIYRNIKSDNVRLTRADPPAADHLSRDAVPGPEIYVDREAMLFRGYSRRRVTDDGYSVSEEMRQLARTVGTAY